MERYHCKGIHRPRLTVKYNKFPIMFQKSYRTSCHRLKILKKESIEILHQGGAEFMELIFCGKRDARAVLVLYKYCLYFRNFVGICFDLVPMWKVSCFCPTNHQIVSSM